MKKKLFSILIAICMVIPMTFSLVACDDEKTPEEPAATQTSTQTVSKEDAMTSDNVTLSYTSTVYDGTEKEPTVVVKYDDKVVSSDNYTVSYSNNVNVGTATVVVTSNEDSEILNAGLSFSTTFEIERHPIYVSTISQLNAAIQVTDENHVIVLASNIALERDSANKVVPVLVFPKEKNLDVAIDLAGYDINSYFRVVSEHEVNKQTVSTDNVAKLNVYNSSNEESFVGAVENEIDYAIIIKAKNVFDIDFENVTFNAYWGGITTNGNCVSETTINARNCKFIATKDTAADGYDASIGAYLVSGKHIYTFESCTFEGFGGYYTKSGHHTLIDCEVKGLGTIAFDTHHEKNGCFVTGSALMVDSAEAYSNVAATGYTHGLTLNISGGRYSSVAKYAVEEFATYTNTRTCYAFIHVTDAPEFVGSTSLAKSISVEDVNSIHGSGLDVEHKHAYVIGHTAENHFDICNCGDKQNIVAHIWNSGEVVTPATFEVDGVMKYTCTVCEREKNEAYQYATDRTAIYVDTLDELNNAIKTTDENHVIVLTADIVASSPDAVLIYPEGKDYKVAIDLNGFDINSYFRIVSKHGGVKTNKLADVYIFNSSENESVVGFAGESDYYAIQIMTDNEYNINLKNVTFKAYWGAIASSGNNVSETKVNAYNCKFISTKVGCADGDAGTGSYLVSAKHIYTFKACEFEGFSGYYTKNGHHNLINCLITANGVPASNAEYNGSGAHLTGSALIIDSAENYNKGKATGYATDLTVNVVGGVLTSAVNYAVEEVSTYKVLANRVSYAAVTLDGVTYRVPSAFERALSFENSSAITSHSYSNDADVECNKCGAKRELANYDVWDGTIAALPEIVNNEVTIETAEQLAGLAAAVNAGTKYRDITFKLAKNIDLNNFEWTPIGVGDSPSKNAFVGIFDGQGYTIYNLKITKYKAGSKHAGASSGVGLFGNIGNHTTLKNVVIDGADVYGNHYVGALVGYTSYSRIENCVVYNAKVNCVYHNEDDSGDKAGAIVGLLQNTKLYDSAAYNSTVSAGRDAGQLVGCASGASVDWERCSATNVRVSANGTNNGSNVRELIIGRDSAETNKWNGTIETIPTAVDNVITIRNAAELAAVANSVNQGNTFAGYTIKLARNLDLRNIEWTPIGYGPHDVKLYFDGTFDGNGKTIYNLKITSFVGGSTYAGAASGVGLFGHIGKNAIIKNVKIDGANVYGNHYVGALVGYAYYSDILDCSVKNATISCVAVNDDENGDKAGAVVGHVANSNLTNLSASKSTVSAGRDAGQVVGCIANNTKLTNLSATNVVVSANGTANGANINNEVLGRDAASVNYWNGTIGTLPEAVDKVITIQYASELAALAKAVNEGNDFAGYTIKLGRNIDLMNLEWTPIGYGYSHFSQVTKYGASFRGIFDGQGKTISNLKITTFVGGGTNAGTAAGVGLFGHVVAAEIKNVKITGATVVGNHYVGTVVGFGLNSSISNCVVKNAAVSCTYADDDESGDKAGVIVGQFARTNSASATASITDCSATSSTVNADRDAGQIIGCLDNNPVQTGNTVKKVKVSCNNSGAGKSSKTGTNITNGIVGRVD